MADQPFAPLHLRSDADLVAALRAMDREIDWPAAAAATGRADVAGLVRARLVADGAGTENVAGRGRKPAGRSWRWTPVRRAFVVAVIVALALAAAAGAAGLGLPGLRIIFGGPSAAPSAPATRSSPTPPPSDRVPGVPGAGLRLGNQVGLDVLDERAGFIVRIPADSSVGPPSTGWVNPALNDQVSLVWASSDRLPATNEPGVGLVLTAFRGAVSDAWFTKAIGPGTIVRALTVDGHRGYWITGDPHQFFYEGPVGFVEDSRRWVGDVLLWADGPITYRLETSLGRDAAIAVAESMP